MEHPEIYSSFDCGHLSTIAPPKAQVPQRFPHSCQSCAFTEAERREQQINEESDPLIRQERDAEIEGRRLLKMDKGRNDMCLATEVARAGAEVMRLKRIRDQKLLEVWNEWKDVWASNNRCR